MQINSLFINKLLSFVLMFIAVFLFSILITYNHLDISFNSTDFFKKTLDVYAFRNYFADILIQIFGVTIYIVPTLLLLYSYLLFNNIVITNIAGKVASLIMFLILAPINNYLYLDKYSAGILGGFLVNYLPIIEIVGVAIVPINILLLFISIGFPLSNYKKIIVDINYFITKLFHTTILWLQQSINTRKPNTTKIVVTPDINYIEEGIKQDDEVVNLKEYEKRNKNILKNNLFLRTLNDINEQQNLSNNNAQSTIQNLTRSNTLNYDSNLSDNLTEMNNIDIKRPTGKELQKDNGSIVKKLFKNYSIPLNLLSIKSTTNVAINKAEISKNAANLEKVMKEFGILGKIVNIVVGPVVTMYEITIPAGMKTTKLTSLETDIALRMSAISVRIAVIPGKDVIGIELPNVNRNTIYLKEVIQSSAFEKSTYSLPITLGLDTSGKPIIEDLSTMPHCLIAGTTGSGKSVGINTIILSLLYKFSPEHCKLIMIDPKMLELSVYQDIPHLITPVVTDPKKAVSALKWAVKEMDIRYNLMSILGVRNIIGYNEKIKDTDFIEQKINDLPEEQQGIMEFNFMPYIAVIIDEMADLMLVAGKEVEIAVQRLAQKARAAGIHVIMATQRPSTDVITGTIKANFPTRISFKVSSSIDSRTILNSNGAEQLLGKGDMLYLSGVGLKRVHGPFVSDDEVVKVAEYVKTLGKPNYVNDVISTPLLDSGEDESEEDIELVEKAIEVIQLTGKVSVSHLQNKLRIGFNKSTRLVDLLEAKGIVGPDKGAGKRDIFIK